MAKQTGRQQEIVGRVMHEFKHGELETAAGRKVRNPQQAIAIGLSEAGASNRESPAANRRNKARTERNERAGKTARQQKEGQTAKRETAQRAPKRETAKRAPQREGAGDKTRAELYREAQRRGISGLSRASKAELEAALRRR